MMGEIYRLKRFVQAMAVKSYEDRKNCQAVCDLLSHTLPDTYRTLLADLADYPLATILPVAASVLDVADYHKSWVYGVVRELHTRSTEARRGTPA